MKSTIHKQQNKENLGSFSCMRKKMKRKKRFQTMKQLLEMEETPWSILHFRPKHQEGTYVEEEKCGEEQQVPSHCLKFSKKKQFHPSVRVVAKKHRQSQSCKRRMVAVNDDYSQVELTSSVMQRAEAVQENLDAKFPSFVKTMIRSNVTKGFWLSLPRLFCKLHLPDHDATIVLEDEDRKQHLTKYLAQRRGLSGGWMGFSIAHNLIEGDVLVFHRVKMNKLKVYIIRSSCLDEVDAALCLMDLDAHAKQKDSGLRSDDYRSLQVAGEKNRSSSETVRESTFDEDVPNSNIGLVMDHPNSIGWDLQAALEGLIAETCSIANAIKDIKLNAF